MFKSVCFLNSPLFGTMVILLNRQRLDLLLHQYGYSHSANNPLALLIALLAANL
jgi:hypothetical protein